MNNALIFSEKLLAPSETFILAQAQALRRFHPIFVGLERHPRSLPLEHPLLLTAGSGIIAAMRAKIYRKLGAAPLFHRGARRFAPRLLHAHFAGGGLTAMPLARSLRVPLLVTLHGADITVRGASQQYRALAQAASVFLCVSHFIRERALDAGLPESKLIVHPIGIDRSRFAPANGSAQRGVLFVGRLVEKKGCEYLVRAMQHVQQQHPDAHLTVLGDGPLRAQLQALAKEQRVSCTFLGAQPSSEVRKHLREAMLLCCPSVTAGNGDSEGLPTVLAEGQASGTALVATNHAGIPEIITNGETGLLVEERDVSGLADAIAQLIADEPLRQRLRKAAFANVERCFDLPTQTALLEEIYDRFV